MLEVENKENLKQLRDEVSKLKIELNAQDVYTCRLKRGTINFKELIFV